MTVADSCVAATTSTTSTTSATATTTGIVLAQAFPRLGTELSFTEWEEAGVASLAQHLYDGKPIIPGTYWLELMGKAAEAIVRLSTIRMGSKRSSGAGVLQKLTLQDVEFKVYCFFWGWGVGFGLGLWLGRRLMVLVVVRVRLRVEGEGEGESEDEGEGEGGGWRVEGER